MNLQIHEGNNIHPISFVTVTVLFSKEIAEHQAKIIKSPSPQPNEQRASASQKLSEVKKRFNFSAATSMPVKTVKISKKLSDFNSDTVLRNMLSFFLSFFLACLIVFIIYLFYEWLILC